ncbi:helix-turn-helix domain-containing protein [Trinickia sp. EG282A]|uniref:helix-turn-helix domain-containing protein n=1 Tax=Trinickia sp. EG282A TaxID=3237013 RepID=UPI0034D2652C
MSAFSLALPDEICRELGQRVRDRRVGMNLPALELAARIGVSHRTVLRFEATGKCTLDTFVKILEALGAIEDLQPVLAAPVQSIAEMRERATASTRKRAYRKGARQ